MIISRAAEMPTLSLGNFLGGSRPPRNDRLQLRGASHGVLPPGKYAKTYGPHFGLTCGPPGRTQDKRCRTGETRVDLNWFVVVD